MFRISSKPIIISLLTTTFFYDLIKLFSPVFYIVCRIKLLASLLFSIVA
nr:MAG TPA: hypothetical protein [Caudoviricetes sp.]